MGTRTTARRGSLVKGHRWRWTLYEGSRPYQRPAFCWRRWAKGVSG